ncbi:hypothetical protein AG1IA_06328 [Rhizoctonia solani AG-1 IA]|uniref:Uncharacterized protein n=1 Tax=Thanatephorus cucumeris (strain AG1-IA) TaxID=983506 RepID=L8WS77_THACA|nr:hypothetical protein AG1IA_06328 [Rhizoctonia solani AG-1 IA]
MFNLGRGQMLNRSQMTNSINCVRISKKQTGCCLFGAVGCYSSYRTMNEKGEFPWMYHLRNTSSNSSGELCNPILGKELVAYLKFYNIGTELIEEGTENLKPNKEADAQKALGYFLYYLRPLET